MKTTKRSDRRKFLLTAGIGSAGVAAAVVSRTAPENTKGAGEEGAQPSGYHLSEHILKYYKTTQV